MELAGSMKIQAWIVNSLPSIKAVLPEILISFPLLKVYSFEPNSGSLVGSTESLKPKYALWSEVREENS